MKFESLFVAVMFSLPAGAFVSEDSPAPRALSTTKQSARRSRAIPSSA